MPSLCDSDGSATPSKWRIRHIISPALDSGLRTRFARAAFRRGAVSVNIGVRRGASLGGYAFEGVVRRSYWLSVSVSREDQEVINGRRLTRRLEHLETRLRPVSDSPLEDYISGIVAIPFLCRAR